MSQVIENGCRYHHNCRTCKLDVPSNICAAGPKVIRAFIQHREAVQLRDKGFNLPMMAYNLGCSIEQVRRRLRWSVSNEV